MGSISLIVSQLKKKQNLTCTYTFSLVNCLVHVIELIMQVFHGIPQVLPEQV